MSEEEPFLPLRWGDKELHMTSRNSQLYTFAGRTAIKIGNDTFEVERSALNHVWIATSENSGAYFWAEHDPEEYKVMSSFIIEHAFPAHLNARDVSSHDIQAWLREVDKEVEHFAQAIPNEI